MKKGKYWKSPDRSVRRENKAAIILSSCKTVDSLDLMLRCEVPDCYKEGHRFKFSGWIISLPCIKKHALCLFRVGELPVTGFDSQKHGQRYSGGAGALS